MMSVYRQVSTVVQQTHLMMDPTERVLYIADTGGGRILRMNPDSGHFIRNAKREFPIYSSIAETFEYSIYGCAEWEVFADGLDKPSGLHVDDTHVYVGEWQSSTIVAFAKRDSARWPDTVAIRSFVSGCVLR